MNHAKLRTDDDHGDLKHDYCWIISRVFQLPVNCTFLLFCWISSHIKINYTMTNPWAHELSVIEAWKAMITLYTYELGSCRFALRWMCNMHCNVAVTEWPAYCCPFTLRSYCTRLRVRNRTIYCSIETCAIVSISCQRMISGVQWDCVRAYTRTHARTKRFWFFEFSLSPPQKRSWARRHAHHLPFARIQIGQSNRKKNVLIH